MVLTRWTEPAHWAGFVFRGTSRAGEFAGLSQFLVTGETQGPWAAFATPQLARDERVGMTRVGCDVGGTTGLARTVVS
jgi:hypothetical protein